MFARYFFVCAEEEYFEGLLEVVVEGDVDHGVDHGVGVGKHVDPEGVLVKLRNSCYWLIYGMMCHGLE